MGVLLKKMAVDSITQLVSSVTQTVLDTLLLAAERNQLGARCRSTMEGFFRNERWRPGHAQAICQRMFSREPSLH